MVKEVRQYFCDACGKEIKGEYRGHIGVSSFLYADGEAIDSGDGFDFCKECMISFGEWRKSRKASRLKHSV